jgi:hypothetical protein
VTMAGVPNCAFAAAVGLFCESGTVVEGSRGVDALARAAEEALGFGPIGAVPGEVDGICESGIPEIGETFGCAGRVLKPDGNVAGSVAPEDDVIGGPLELSGD